VQNPHCCLRSLRPLGSRGRLERRFHLLICPTSPALLKTNAGPSLKSTMSSIRGILLYLEAPVERSMVRRTTGSGWPTIRKSDPEVYLIGREPVMRIFTSLLALGCQSGWTPRWKRLLEREAGRQGRGLSVCRRQVSCMLAEGRQNLASFARLCTPKWRYGDT
jgi:hypothetical protein